MFHGQKKIFLNSKKQTTQRSKYNSKITIFCNPVSIDTTGDVKEQLIKFCEQHLADFKVIRDVHIMDDFPRSALQKIAKYKLREQLLVIA